MVPQDGLEPSFLSKPDFESFPFISMIFNVLECNNYCCIQVYQATQAGQIKVSFPDRAIVKMFGSFDSTKILNE